MVFRRFRRRVVIRVGVGRVRTASSVAGPRPTRGYVSPEYVSPLRPFWPDDAAAGRRPAPADPQEARRQQARLQQRAAKARWRQRHRRRVRAERRAARPRGPAAVAPDRGRRVRAAAPRPPVRAAVPVRGAGPSRWAPRAAAAPVRPAAGSPAAWWTQTYARPQARLTLLANVVTRHGAHAAVRRAVRRAVGVAGRAARRRCSRAAARRAWAAAVRLDRRVAQVQAATAAPAPRPTPSPAVARVRAGQAAVHRALAAAAGPAVPSRAVLTRTVHPRARPVGAVAGVADALAQLTVPVRRYVQRRGRQTQAVWKPIRLSAAAADAARRCMRRVRRVQPRTLPLVRRLTRVAQLLRARRHRAYRARARWRRVLREATATLRRQRPSPFQRRRRGGPVADDRG